MNEILKQAKQWLVQDPDFETRALLETHIRAAENGDAQSSGCLKTWFSGRLGFGTAGLRGRLQPGPMGMNRVLVAQTARGLADYLLANESNLSIVIGYDGRKNSAIFARDTAEIMAGAGIRAILLPRALPTPVLAYAIHDLNAGAGVMVTASHNPPEDNGYKVYLGAAQGGGQIIAPVDTLIAQAIDRAALKPIDSYARAQNYTVADDSIWARYVSKTAKYAENTPKMPLNYVYTALHGVGKETLLAVLNAANLPLPHIVEAQADPDPNFPTVSFPNPEEKHALDLAIETAKKHNAEWIIANDPDADRFAIALPDENGEWKSVHGNAVGGYLAWHIAKKAQQSGKKGALVCSLVSSPVLTNIAQHYGLRHEETLIGFKYIAKVPDILYGYEESLGYLVDPEKVSDKDGISAAMAFLDLVCCLKNEGKTLRDYIDAFNQQFGVYESQQISLRFNDLQEIHNMMQAFRQYPPSQMGAQNIVRYQDYAQHSEPHNILVYHLADGARVIIRPSGTEPKIKIYLDVQGETPHDARARMSQLVQEIQDLLRQEIYGAHQI